MHCAVESVILSSSDSFNSAQLEQYLSTKQSVVFASSCHIIYVRSCEWTELCHGPGHSGNVNVCASFMPSSIIAIGVANLPQLLCRQSLRRACWHYTKCRIQPCNAGERKDSCEGQHSRENQRGT